MARPVLAIIHHTTSPIPIGRTSGFSSKAINLHANRAVRLAGPQTQSRAAVKKQLKHYITH